MHSHKDVDQRKKTENSEITLYTYGQGILDKAAKKIMGKNSLNKWPWDNQIVARKIIKLVQQ